MQADSQFILPPELLDKIIDCVVEYDQHETPPYKDLFNCCLVSKSFLHRSRALLYRDLIFTCTEQSLQVGGPQVELPIAQGVMHYLSMDCSKLERVFKQNQTLLGFLENIVIAGALLEEGENINASTYVMSRLLPILEGCSRLYEVTVKGFTPIDCQLLVKKLSAVQPKLNSIVIEGTFLGGDLGAMINSMRGFIDLKQFVIYGHWDTTSLKDCTPPNWNLTSFACGSYAHQLLPLLAVNSGQSLEQLNLQIDDVEDQLPNNFNLSLAYPNLKLFAFIGSTAPILNRRIADLENYSTLDTVILVIRPEPKTREEAEKYLEIDLTKIPRKLKWLDLSQFPVPVETILHYGKNTKRGHGNMIWAEGLWTQEEKELTCKVWDEREQEEPVL